MISAKTCAWTAVAVGLPVGIILLGLAIVAPPYSPVKTSDGKILLRDSWGRLRRDSLLSVDLSASVQKRNESNKRTTNTTTRTMALDPNLTDDERRVQTLAQYKVYRARDLPGPPEGYVADPNLTRLRPRGLVNMGNTCYFNSITQCFASMYHLVGFEGVDFSSCFPAMQDYKHVLRRIRRLDEPGAAGPVDPGVAFDGFRETVFDETSNLFRRGHQEDSAETRRHILTLANERCPAFLAGTELIGRAMHRGICQACLQPSLKEVALKECIMAFPYGVRREPISIGQLAELSRQARPGWDHGPSCALFRQWKRNQNGILPTNALYQQIARDFRPTVLPPAQLHGYTLAGMFNQDMSAVERMSRWSVTARGTLTLDDHNECEACNSSIDKWIQTVPTRMPDVLNLEVRRYQHPSSARINTDVALPEYWEPVPGRVYRFLSASLHAGESRHGGHYWAVVRYGDTYWNMNDSSATPTTFEAVRSGPSVVALFYELIHTYEPTPEQLAAALVTGTTVAPVDDKEE